MLGASGSFAGYCRASLSRLQIRLAKKARAVQAGLFPLPLQPLLQIDGRRRSVYGRRRWGEAQATRALALLSGLALNWEATGRPHAAEAKQYRANAAQLRTLERIRSAARSMLHAARGVELRRLSLGRGKLAAGWESLDVLIGAVRGLQTEVPYGRRSVVLGELDQKRQQGPESVDVPRVALPEVEPHFDLAPLLVDEAVRNGYLDPATLEHTNCPRSEWSDAEQRALGAELEGWLDANPTFLGRVCDKLQPNQREPFLRALDTRGMLFAFRDVGGKKCGFFCVRKEWDVERGLWVLRLVLDRRPRNAQERAVRATDDAFPHGSCFLDIILGSGEHLLLWISDLPSFYYTMMVTDERARTNQFTDVLDEEPYADLRAVRELHEREEAAGGPDDACRRNGQVVFGLRCMAMGDRNATTFAQAAHTQLLKNAGLLGPRETIAYGKAWPRGRVAEGVMIDDKVTAVIAPNSGAGYRELVAEGRRRFERTLDALHGAGLEDVPKKRKLQVSEAVVWGCEVRGRAGRAGAPRARRGALSALTVGVALLGAATVDLLMRLMGLWTDTLLYRREAFAAVGALYRFIQQYKDDPQHRARTLPGPVRSELLLLASLAPMLDANLRAPVSPVIKVTDSSLDGACAVDVAVPDVAARELWRHRLGPGRYDALDKAAGLRRGDAFVGEILEGCAARKRLQFRYRRAVASINLGEARARRALWRTLSAAATEHGQRHLVAYDSRVVLAAAARGRARGWQLLREFRLTYPHLLASDSAEGALWTDSERNTADSGSRSGPLPVPAPQRAWVHAFFGGDLRALDRRLNMPEGDEPDIVDPLPHQLPDDATFEEIRDAMQRERDMHVAVKSVKAPWLSGRCFRTA